MKSSPITSILNVNVSCFENYFSQDNPKTVNLLSWLLSNKYSKEVEEIRQLPSKKDRDKIKATLPAITPSGIFEKRRESSLIKHSHLIAFDIDLDQENQNIANWNDIKKQLSHIPNIAYCGLSVSGKGYWGLIPIVYPEKHKQHFAALALGFESLGIHLDPAPKNVASLRGYSWDSQPYFNHQAISFTKVIEQTKGGPLLSENHGEPNTGALNWAINELLNASDGERHLRRLEVSNFIGKLIGMGRIRYEDAEQTLIDAYVSQYGMIDPVSVQKKEIKAIYDGLKNGMRT